MAKIQGLRITMDRRPEVLKAMKEQVEQGLAAIGLEAEKYAKGDCPVDTGRLRNSITYVTSKHQGTPNEGGFERKGGGTPDSAKPEDYTPLAKPDKDDLSMYLGTNVEYAEAVEFRDMTHQTGKAHFLRDAVADHKDQYKEIMRAALNR